MSKTVLLLRHAKSSWDNPGLGDFDRPLAPRGAKAAPRMAAYLEGEGLRPDLVLCSAACRAVQTWELVAAGLGDDVPVKFMRSLYLSPPARLLAAVQRTPEDVSRLLLIGHNPGMAHLAARLSGPSSPKPALSRMRQKYPTAALAEIQFDAPGWGAVAEGGGRLRRFVCPKDLR